MSVISCRAAGVAASGRLHSRRTRPRLAGAAARADCAAFEVAAELTGVIGRASMGRWVTGMAGLPATGIAAVSAIGAEGCCSVDAGGCDSGEARPAWAWSRRLVYQPSETGR